MSCTKNGTKKITAIVCFRIKEKEPGIATRLFDLFHDLSGELTPLIFTRAMLQPTTERRKNSPCYDPFTFLLYPYFHHCAYNAKKRNHFRSSVFLFVGEQQCFVLFSDGEPTVPAVEMRLPFYFYKHFDVHIGVDAVIAKTE